MLINVKKVDNDNQKSLILSKEIADELDIKFLQHTNLRFGFRAVDLNVSIDESLGKNEMVLSSMALAELNLPLNCSYNVKVVENEIIIGPFMGIYLGRKESTLFKKLRMLESYAVNYPDLNGVILGFTLDQVNKNDLTINGYYYDPKLGIWKNAELPYPASIFRKNTYDMDWREYFGSLYGNRIFNYKTLDKWTMHHRLSQFEEVNKHLPATALYNDTNDVMEFMNKHQDVYIKPITGKKGLGIYNVVFNDEKFIVKTREKKENMEWNFSDKVEFTNFLQERLTKGNYIIQKTIDIRVNNKTMDFRVGVDKDQSGTWKNYMFISRVSGDNSIVSNRALSQGTIQYIPDVLREIYNMNDQEINEYVERMKKLALNVANKLELTGIGLGKLAFDIAIDNDKNIWIIEINSKYPDDNLMNELDNRKKYYEIRHVNMLYAKRLAGFEEMDNNILMKFANEEQVNNETKKYIIHVGLPKNKKDEFEKLISAHMESLQISGPVKFNKTMRKFVIKLETSDKKLNEFIELLKYGEEHYEKSVIALTEITN